MQEIELDAGEMFRSVGLDRIADEDPSTAEDLRAYIAARMCWVAELDGTVVGYSTASVVDAGGHLDQVSVARSAARQGIGAALIEAVCGWSVASGFGSVTLTTFLDVAWNAPYYERLGFVSLNQQDLGPELAEIRRSETAAELDITPRLAMRKNLRGRSITRPRPHLS